jgi:hypothetical protein
MDSVCSALSVKKSSLTVSSLKKKLSQVFSTGHKMRSSPFLRMNTFLTLSLKRASIGKN